MRKEARNPLDPGPEFGNHQVRLEDPRRLAELTPADEVSAASPEATNIAPASDPEAQSFEVETSPERFTNSDKFEPATDANSQRKRTRSGFLELRNGHLP